MTTLLKPSKSLLTLGQVSNESLSVTSQSSYSVDTATALLSVISDTSKIRLIPTPDCSNNAVTFALHTTAVELLYTLLKTSSYNCNNLVETASSILAAKLQTRSDWHEFTRREKTDLDRAFEWLRGQTYQINRSLETTQTLTKEVNTNIQSVPDNDTLVQNLAIIDEEVAISTNLGYKIGQDTDFLTKYEDLINIIQPVNISEDVATTLEVAPINLGVEGVNTAPVVTGDKNPIFITSDSSNQANSQADDNYWLQIEDEISDLCDPATLLVPIRDQKAVMADLINKPYDVEEQYLYVQASTTEGGTPAATLIQCNVASPVTIDDVITTIGAKNLLELDWAVEVTSVDTEKLVQAMSTIPTITTTSSESPRIIVPTRKLNQVFSHPNITALSSDEKSKIMIRSVMRPTVFYSQVQAFSLSSVLSRVWGAIKSTKISDIQNITNLASTGLAIAGKLSGSQGLTNASTVMDTISNGLGTIQAQSAQLKAKLPKSTMSDIFQSQAMSILTNILPSSIKLAKNAQKKTSSDNTNILDKTDQIAKRIKNVKQELLDVTPVTTNRYTLQSTIVSKMSPKNIVSTKQIKNYPYQYRV